MAITPAAKSKGGTKTPATGADGMPGHCTVTWNGEKKIDRPLSQAELRAMVKSLPTMMAAWKPGRYELRIVCDVTKPAVKKPAAKKTPARKVAPMH